MLSRQKLFDTICTHMLTQKVHSAGRLVRPYGGYWENAGLYHAPDGKRCGIGCLIPDTLYRKSVEGNAFANLYSGNVRNPSHRNALQPIIEHLRRLIRLEDVNFVQAFQTMHDSDTHGPAEWPGQMRDVAKRYGVDASIVDRLQQLVAVEV